MGTRSPSPHHAPHPKAAFLPQVSRSVPSQTCNSFPQPGLLPLPHPAPRNTHRRLPVLPPSPLRSLRPRSSGRGLKAAGAALPSPRAPHPAPLTSNRAGGRQSPGCPLRAHPPWAPAPPSRSPAPGTGVWQQREVMRRAKKLAGRPLLRLMSARGGQRLGRLLLPFLRPADSALPLPRERSGGSERAAQRAGLPSADGCGARRHSQPRSVGRALLKIYTVCSHLIP